MAPQDEGAMVQFSVGPFFISRTLPASKFESLDPPPWFLAPGQNVVVSCPELSVQVWHMFVSWVYTRDYDVPKPGKKCTIFVQAVRVPD